MTYTILWTQRPGGNVSGWLMRRASYLNAPSMAGALGEFLRNPPVNAVVQQGERRLCNEVVDGRISGSASGADTVWPVQAGEERARWPTTTKGRLRSTSEERDTIGGYELWNRSYTSGYRVIGTRACALSRTGQRARSTSRRGLRSATGWRAMGFCRKQKRAAARRRLCKNCEDYGQIDLINPLYLAHAIEELTESEAEAVDRMLDI